MQLSMTPAKGVPTEFMMVLLFAVLCLLRIGNELLLIGAGYQEYVSRAKWFYDPALFPGLLPLSLVLVISGALRYCHGLAR